MKIILGVCGSVACYKTFDVARELVKQGHEVRVILTNGAMEFVKPELFKYLGINHVYLPDDDFIPDKTGPLHTVLHIELARWADRLAIVGLTANTLAKLSSGRADDLLSTVFLSLNAQIPTLVFPAMNTSMLGHPFTQENLSKLQTLKNVLVIAPEVGTLACNEIGIGKLPASEKIIDIIPHATPAAFLKKSKILISTGATIAPLDEVRYLTNPSSGITGILLAMLCLQAGHQVTLIAGEGCKSQCTHLDGLPGFKIYRAQTTQDMLNLVQEEFPLHDVYVSAAAIGDFEFEPVAAKKIKKQDLAGQLKIRPAVDVLAQVLKIKKNSQYVVGFAAETELTTDVLNEKFTRKPVDLLVGTLVGRNGLGTVGFGTAEAQYKVVELEGIRDLGILSKRQLAHFILEKINLWLS